VQVKKKGKNTKGARTGQHKNVGQLCEEHKTHFPRRSAGGSWGKGGISETNLRMRKGRGGGKKRKTKREEKWVRRTIPSGRAEGYKCGWQKIKRGVNQSASSYRINNRKH